MLNFLLKNSEPDYSSLHEAEVSPVSWLNQILIKSVLKLGFIFFQALHIRKKNYDGK